MSWAALLSYEFNTQARIEDKLNIEISPYFRYSNILSFYQGQVGFISKSHFNISYVCFTDLERIIDNL